MEVDKKQGENDNTSKLNDEESNMSRRNFIKSSGIAVGGVAGGLLLGGLLGNPFKTEETISTTTKPEVKFTEAMQFFTRKEDFETLAAATEVIFPADKHGPGCTLLY